MKLLGYLFACSILLGILIALEACNSLEDASQCSPNLPNPKTWRIPSYPTTKQTQNNYSIDSIKPMIFETSDDSKAVLIYYKDILTQSGWILDQSSSSPNELIFRVVNCCRRMWLSIIVETKAGGQTRVTIQPGWGMACL